MKNWDTPEYWAKYKYRVDVNYDRVIGSRSFPISMSVFGETPQKAIQNATEEAAKNADIPDEHFFSYHAGEAHALVGMPITEFLGS